MPTTSVCVCQLLSLLFCLSVSIHIVHCPNYYIIIIKYYLHDYTWDQHANCNPLKGPPSSTHDGGGDMKLRRVWLSADIVIVES